jgi:predicted component of type VI protein secretion system
VAPTDGSVTPAETATGAPVDPAASAAVDPSTIVAREPVVTAASAAGTAVLPDVTGGGVPDPSSTVSSQPSDTGTASSETQPSASWPPSSTPIYDQLIKSSGEEDILHEEVAPNLANPTPVTTYANDHHIFRKQGLTWGLQHIGWIGPEVVTFEEHELVALRSLLDQIITDLGL